MTLTAEQREAIGLQTVAADFHDIDTVLALNAVVAYDPNRHVFVSTRIEGKVESILVNVGDRVTRDQKLAVVQSRQIGNPPPTIAITAPIAGVVDERLVAPGEADSHTSRWIQLRSPRPWSGGRAGRSSAVAGAPS